MNLAMMESLTRDPGVDPTLQSGALAVTSTNSYWYWTSNYSLVTSPVTLYGRDSQTPVFYYYFLMNNYYLVKSCLSQRISSLDNFYIGFINGEKFRSSTENIFNSLLTSLNQKKYIFRRTSIIIIIIVLVLFYT